MAESRTKGFGERLRRAREEAGRDVRSLAEVTRVQGRYIEALENEDWAVVPKGVIGRGFVRVLARELGVPAPELLQLYQASRGDADSEPDRTLPEADWKVDLPDARKGRQLLLAGGAAVVVVLVLVVWFVRHRAAAPQAVPAAVEQPAATPPEAKPSAPPPSPAPAPAPALSPTPAPPGAPAPAAAPKPAPAAQAAAAPAPAVPVAPPAAEPAKGAFKLELQARERVWVKVVVDGAAPNEKVLKAGEKAVYQGSKGAQVKLGNAGAVKLVWNGTALKSAGEGSQVVTLTLPQDLAGLKP